MQEFISRNREALAVVLYGASSVASLLLALTVDNHGVVALGAVWQPVLVLLALRLVTHRLYRLTTSRWRFVGIADVLRLVYSTSVATAVFAALNATGVLGVELAWTVVGLEWVLSIFMTSGLWITYRSLFEHFRRGAEGVGIGLARRTIIIGAGEAGNLLAREIIRTEPGMTLVGFLDDDPHKAGTYVQGLRVFGRIDDLTRILKEYALQRVIIAIPSLGTEGFRRIVQACESSDVEYRVLPGIKEVLGGNVSVRQLRRVTIEDILGREPVSVELPELSRELEGATVVVTGAGGSIGSELARQLAANQPSRLILVDKAESDLFFTELELLRRHPDLSVRAVIGDVCDRRRMGAIIREEGVTHLYHAAAYKHVPLMEENVSEAIRNNVDGTRVLMEEAGRAGLRSFVLISTDKAVRPANVMGATKRLCEVLLLAAAKRHRATRYTAVRFGNVLGSNGSVVQVFRRQLETGVLTVTHPDITRYFMTVGEAVQLVLLASTLPEVRGRIVMLEMGEPVRIMELAQNMIRLSGLVEGRDVRIRISGLRPGEKLHEELVAPFETTETTQNGKIQLVSTEAASASILARCDELIELAAAGRDGEARELLRVMTDWEADDDAAEADSDLDRAGAAIGAQAAASNGVPRAQAPAGS